MKAILTGMNGTVAPALAELLAMDGHEVIAWDRNRIPADNSSEAEHFILETKPDWFFQIATGSPDWIEMTARVCKEQRIPYLFTGSVSVFDGSKSGPFAVDHVMDAPDDYGKYKADCERRIQSVNPDAIIARLGWQIGDAPGSNNMIDFLTTQQKEHGRIEASTGWIPSTAFLIDSAEGLYRLMKDGSPGVYQLEGNTKGLSFFELVTALNLLHGNPWTVVAKEEPERDIRMISETFSIGSLDARLQNNMKN